MAFETADFRFAIVPLGASDAAGGSHEFEWYLDDPLQESGRLPALDSAPTASWFLARLRAIDSAVPAETKEENDGGGYCLEVAVAEGEAIVASFQLQGDMEGVAGLGRTKDADTADRILDQLVQLLTESPNDLAECCYSVVDPEWEFDPDCFVPTPDEDSENEYGWRAGLFLGAHNIRED